MTKLQEQDFNFSLKKNTDIAPINKKFISAGKFVYISSLVLFTSLIWGYLFLISDINNEYSMQSYQLYQTSKANYSKNSQDSNVVDGFSSLLQSYRLMSLSDSNPISSLNELFSIFEKTIQNNKLSKENKLKIQKDFFTYLDNYNLDEEKICKNNKVICSLFKPSETKIQENQREVDLIKEKVIKINF